jgi:hypothetical protein
MKPSREWEIAQEMRRLIAMIARGEASGYDLQMLYDLQTERVRRMRSRRAIGET